MKSSNFPRSGIIFLLLFFGVITARDSTALSNDIEETISSVPYLTIVEGAKSEKSTINKDKERSNSSVSPFDPAANGATAYYAEFSEAQDQIIIISGGEINGAFWFTFQNFANAGGPAIIQKAGGNTSSTSLDWNEDKPTPIEITISETSSGGAQLQSKIETDGGTNNGSQSTNLPSSCSYSDLDRARVLIAAGDEDLKITLSGEFDGQTEELVVENGVTPGNQEEHVVGGLDFSDGLNLNLELDIEGNNRSSDGTSRVELEFGCPG